MSHDSSYGVEEQRGRTWFFDRLGIGSLLYLVDEISNTNESREGLRLRPLQHVVISLRRKFLSDFLSLLDKKSVGCSVLLHFSREFLRTVLVQA